MAKRRLLLAVLLLVSLAGCTSTGNPLCTGDCASRNERSYPIKFYGWRMYLFGHEKYTPEERAYSACVYRNRLPDGSRSGFSRLCRQRATMFPMGVNSAMYASLCKMELCHEAASKVALP